MPGLLILIAPFQNLTLPSLAAAGLICAVWGAYFIRLHQEWRPPWLFSGALLLLGALGDLVAPVLGEWVEALLKFVPLSGWSGELIWASLRIGLVEETLKLAPVVVLFWRRKGEGLFLLIFAGSLAALGFATLENALYFSRYGLGIAYARFLFSTLMHLAITGLACYAWGWVQSFAPRFGKLGLLGSLAVAAVLHGLFDMMMLNPLPGKVGAGLLQLIVLAWFYALVLRSVLQRSSHRFSSQLRLSMRRIICTFFSHRRIISRCKGLRRIPVHRMTLRKISLRSILLGCKSLPGRLGDASLRLNNTSLLAGGGLLLFGLAYLDELSTNSPGLAMQHAGILGLVSLPVALAVLFTLGNLGDFNPSLEISPLLDDPLDQDYPEEECRRTPWVPDLTFVVPHLYAPGLICVVPNPCDLCRVRNPPVTGYLHSQSWLLT